MCMEIVKKVKCLHCEEILEGNKICKCGKVTLAKDVVTEGVLGKDYIDVGQKLLNE